MTSPTPAPSERPSRIKVPGWDYPERRVLRWVGDKPVVPVVDGRTGMELDPMSEWTVEHEWEPLPGDGMLGRWRAFPGSPGVDTVLAFARSEVERATAGLRSTHAGTLADLKKAEDRALMTAARLEDAEARAEKAEAELREREADLAEARDLVREGRELAYDRLVRLRNREEQGQADIALKRVEAFDAFLYRTLPASVAVTQAHEEAGARKTLEPSSAAGNTLPRAESGTGGGSATLRLACELRGLQRNEYVDSADRVVSALRPWLAFVEAQALVEALEQGSDEKAYDAAWESRRMAASALLAATKKEGK